MRPLFVKLRGVELELEEARTELAKRAAEAQSSAEEHEKVQSKLQEQELALKKLRSDCGAVKQQLEKKKQDLEKERTLADRE